MLSILFEIVIFIQAFTHISGLRISYDWKHVDNFKSVSYRQYGIKLSQRRYFTCLGETAMSTDVNNDLTVKEISGSTTSDGLPPRKSYTPRTPEQGGRVYVPRVIDNTAASPAASPRVYQGTGPRVYTPRVDPSSSNSNSNSVMSSSQQPYRNDREQVFALSMPLLLIRFKMPRVKSIMKLQLETLQESYREQSEASRSSNYGGGGRSSYGSSGSGYSSNAADSFDAMFSRIAPKKGAAIPQRTGKPAKEDDDKWGENSKSRSSSSKRSQNEGVVVDEEEFDEEVSEDVGDDKLDGVYYGDEVNRGLSSISAGDLQTMEREGYSLEEMQMTLYGEYGVKTSLSAIKRRLQDDKSERKGKKRTGKTRRDRTKARNARFGNNVDKGISLPTDSNVIQVMELARLMEIGGGEIVKHMMVNMGIMASLTQSIDLSVAKTVITAFGKKLANDDGDDLDEDSDDDDDDDLEVTMDGAIVEKLPRAPIVTIMGHVDHGKTSLLDCIRKTQVAKGEAGGITQGISAFKVKTNQDNFVTFIDTPGHAAFSEMRKRGANVTDIVILVVAADDGIMEQTKECIAAAKGASCPIVIAINKIDKEGADPEKIITGLMSYDILTEEFGGEVQCAKVSAKSGLGIEELLEKIMLQAEVMNLRAAVDIKAEGSVIEARVDKGMGVVVTALVQKGTLRVGDYVLAGPSWGRVRRLVSDQKKELTEAGPSTPVQIVGLSTVPNAGDVFTVTADEASARDVAEARYRLIRQAAGSASSASIMAQALGFAEGVSDRREVIKIPLLIKGDVSGSVEAIRGALDNLELSDEQATCKVDAVFCGVGDVTSSDVAVAAASKAKIIAFNVAAGFNAMDDARASNVEIGYYNVVYDLLDEIEARIKTTLAPPPPGTLIGRAEIKKVFKLGKVGKIAGCMVTEGLLKSESQVRIMRGKRNPVYTGTLSTLKVVKDVVAEVPVGSECGMSFTDFQDFEEGDVVECFVGGSSTEAENR